MSKKINKRVRIHALKSRKPVHRVAAKARPTRTQTKSVQKRVPARAPIAKTVPIKKAISLPRAKPVEEAPKVNMVEVINGLLTNQRVEAYIKQNVSKRAPEVLALLDTPKTDEKIAELLDIKINVARRILNIMQGYGITNYTTQKDSKGWLSFYWYVNTDKIDQFLSYIRKGSAATILSNNCNDYFICKKCYDENKLVFNFDSAYEAGFKCSCNTSFSRVDKEFVHEALADELKKESQTL